jgi:hypothetical protein
MPYWQVVTGSFAIAWRHKYLWLLAIFAGEGGESGFNYSGPPPGTSSEQTAPNFNAIPQQVQSWLGQHLGLVVAVIVISLLLAVALFVLSAVCEGALVRASAEHDADRPFGLGQAWRSGVATMWTIVRFRLLLIALGLPALVIVVALIAGFVAAVVDRSVGLAVAIGLIGFLVLLAAIVYGIYLSFLDRLGTRAVVLEQRKAAASLARGHRLLVKRLGRVLLVWLLSIAVGVVVGICAGIVLGVLSLPAIGAGIATFSGGSRAFWLVIAVSVPILLAAGLVVGGFVGAQSSTYWTLAFRRLELDQPPAYGQLYQATPPVSPSSS